MLGGKGGGLCCCLAMVCLAVPGPLLRAQEQETAQGEAERSLAADPGVIRQPPMTVEQKFTYHLKQSVDPLVLGREALGAAFDQWRDHPGDWAQGWDMYGVRVASHFGQNFIKRQILFGVQALDHETPGHLRSTRQGFKNRVVDAVRYTFISNSDSGKPMPAYSRLIAAYGAAYISRTWYPSSYHTFAAGLSAGSVSLGIDVGMNLLREFGPDIKKKFHHQ
jgi:hypothetical protein